MLSESHPLPSASKQNKLSVGPVKSNIKYPGKGWMDGDTMVMKLAKKVVWNQNTSCFHAFLSLKTTLDAGYPDWLKPERDQLLLHCICVPAYHPSLV